MTVTHTRSWEPPRLYSWTVIAPEKSSPSLGALGALGVTDDRNRALTSLGDALRAAPAGARGLVHKVTLSFTRPGYFYESLVARGWLDPGSSAVVWETSPDRSIWGRLPHASDAIPPEAIAAGLADLEAEQGRP